MDSMPVFSAQPEKPDAILVVDDDVYVLKFVSRMLASLGYHRVFQAASTHEAEDIWSRESANIRLVITDFVMPYQTGDKMALNMQTQRTGLKVLVISGNDPSSLDSAIPLKQGINFLQKPFTVAEMRKSIETLAQCA
jgi:two-component system, cell cycle sensor histidine kinase and response regulator CckA